MPPLGITALPTSNAICSGATPIAPSAAGPGLGFFLAIVLAIALAIVFAVAVLTAGLNALAHRIGTRADAQQRQHARWNFRKFRITTAACLRHHQEQAQRNYESEDHELESRHARFAVFAQQRA